MDKFSRTPLSESTPSYLSHMYPHLHSRLQSRHIKTQKKKTKYIECWICGARAH